VSRSAVRISVFDFFVRGARRSGRYPVAAPAVAVGAACRLRCDARTTRATAMPLAAALNAPLLHGFSPVRRLPRRTSPCVAPLLAPAHMRFAHMTLRRNFVVAAPQVAATGYHPPRGGTRGVLWACHGESGKAVGGCASAATLCGAEDRRAHGRAHAVRASPSDSRRLFEQSERSERSEFRRGPCDRGPEGSRPARPTAVHERWRIPARGFASLDIRKQPRCSTR
jgi:hypothetical protein